MISIKKILIMLISSRFRRISPVILFALFILLISSFFIRDKKINFVDPTKTTQEKETIEFIMPQENDLLFNPFFLKVKIDEKPDYSYKVKLLTTDFKNLYQNNLTKEDNYFIDYIAFNSSDQNLKNAILQIFKLNLKDNSEFLLKQVNINFRDSRLSLKYDSLFKQDRARIQIKDKEFKTIVANTFKKRTLGLSGRAKLKEDEAMIFVFDKPGFESFWMKDMTFSLDMIWIYYDTIVDIKEKLPIPKNPKNLDIYAPSSRANLVLEILSGVSSKYNFKIGDKIKIAP